MQTRPNIKARHLDKSAAWVTPILGRHGKLMYMGPLLSELASRCRDFTVITSNYPADTKSAPFKILIGSKLRGFYWRGKSSYLVGLTFIGPSFYKSIKKTEPEVLFLVEFGLTTIYGLLFKSLNKKAKTVLLVESKPVESDRLILKTIRKLTRKIIAKRCDAILTNNQQGKRFLVEQLKTDPEKIITKPYLISHANGSSGTNSERFLELDSKSTIKLLYVGQIIERKGLQYLIEAIKLAPDNIRPRIHVDIVGEGNYVDELFELIKANKIVDNFQFHGRVEYSELNRFYSSAHVFVFPTLSDYRALSPFEALNAGLPIISSKYDGGCTENVIENENGYICDPVDTRSLSEAIIKVLESPETLYQFSLKSKEISKKYTLESAVDNIIEAADLALSLTNS